MKVEPQLYNSPTYHHRGRYGQVSNILLACNIRISARYKGWIPYLCQIQRLDTTPPPPPPPPPLLPIQYDRQGMCFISMWGGEFDQGRSAVPSGGQTLPRWTKQPARSQGPTLQEARAVKVSTMAPHQQV